MKRKSIPNDPFSNPFFILHKLDKIICGPEVKGVSAGPRARIADARIILGLYKRAIRDQKQDGKRFFLGVAP